MQGQNMSTRIDYSKASPEAFKAFGGVHVALQNGDLSKMLIDLVFLRVSQINGCAYCIDLHSRDLLKLGMTVDKCGTKPNRCLPPASKQHWHGPKASPGLSRLVCLRLTMTR